MISAVKPDEPESNFQQRDNARQRHRSAPHEWRPPVCIDLLDGGVQADLDVQTFKGCLGIGDQLFVEAGKEVRPCAEPTRADLPEPA